MPWERRPLREGAAGDHCLAWPPPDALPLDAHRRQHGRSLAARLGRLVALLPALLAIFPVVFLRSVVVVAVVVVAPLPRMDRSIAVSRSKVCRYSMAHIKFILGNRYGACH